jgi:hypothetical protein
LVGGNSICGKVCGKLLGRWGKGWILLVGFGCGKLCGKARYIKKGRNVVARVVEMSLNDVVLVY